jgi:hypothetical protein
VDATDFLSIGSGGVVGFALGLLGGGGSILAVPPIAVRGGHTRPSHGNRNKRIGGGGKCLRKPYFRIRGRAT